MKTKLTTWRSMFSLLVVAWLSSTTIYAQTTEDFNPSGAIVTWEVPDCVFEITIEASGAEGGTDGLSDFPAGTGAIIEGTVAVTPGETLSILVGEQGIRNGGGGGSFVVRGASTPLVVAGGGGGSCLNDNPNKDAQLGNDGGDSGAVLGGTGGAGGNCDAASSFAGGGGGLTGDGTVCQGSGSQTAALSYTTGGTGGIEAGFGEGGFGGGGYGSGVWSGGGGGGYSGGAAGIRMCGGGGGSFNAGTSPSASIGNTGDGFVQITYTEETDAPTSTCADPIVMTTDMTCPRFIGQNTPDGSWFPIPATGMIQICAGGTFCPFFDLNCIMDNVSDIGDMEIRLATSIVVLPFSNCERIIEQTWDIRDECGNEALGILTTHHVFIDDEAPTSTCADPIVEIIEGCPAGIGPNTTGAMFSPDDTGMATLCVGGIYCVPFDFSCLDDECGNIEDMVLTVASSVALPGASACEIIIEQTYDVDDGCGNVSPGLVTTHHVLRDTEAPIVNLAPGALDLVLNNDEGIDWCPDNFAITCFNLTSGTNPLMGIGGSISFTLSGNFVGNFPGLALADVSDDCNIAEISCSFDNVVVGACQTTFDVVWVATDDCGNASDGFTQSVTLNEIQPPVITPMAMGATFECDGAGNTAEIDAWLAANGGAEATDFCGDVTWTNDYAGLSDDCGETGSATVTFTAEDECGNTSTTTATVTVEDTTDPVFNNIPGSLDVTINIVDQDACPDNFAISCISLAGGGPRVAFILSGVDYGSYDGPADVDEDCGVLANISCSFNNVSVGPCQTTFDVIWTAIDDCGNPSEVFTQSFEINEMAPPTIDPLAMDAIFECDGAGNTAEIDAWLAANGGAVATDFCGDVTWTNDYAGLSDGCGATGSATVTFTAEDECGNTSTTTATVTVEDTTPPTIDPAAMDMTVECDGEGNTAALDAWLNSNGGAIATDICSGVIWTNDFTMLSDDCGATGSATVTFTATDSCGNPSETMATFTIEDTAPPVITMQAMDMTVECDGAGNLTELMEWLDTFGGAEAEEECGTFIWTNDFTMLSDDCGATGSAEVTFFATDECGNISMTTAIFTIEDTTPPVILEEARDVTVDCVDESELDLFAQWYESYAYAVLEDQCGDFTWDATQLNFERLCAGTFTETHRFTATDECGNSTSVTATFLTEDTQAPVVQMPFEEMTISCSEYPDFGVLDATDNCDASPLTWTSSDATTFDEDCAYSYTMTRTSTVFDECGNATTVKQYIHVEDTEQPSLGFNPAGQFAGMANGGTVVVDCNELDSYDVREEAVVVSDNCCPDPSYTLDNVEKYQGNCATDGYVELWVLYWSAEDCCGNTNSLTLNITFIDNDAPVFVSVPDDVTVGCDDELSFDPPQIEDNCAGYFPSYQDSITSGDCVSGFTIIRTYTAVDACGNVTTAVQNIFVIEDGDDDDVTPTPNNDSKKKVTFDGKFDISNGDGGPGTPHTEVGSTPTATEFVTDELTEDEGNKFLRIMPNPANQVINVEFTSLKDQPVTIKVISSKGGEQINKRLSAKEGLNNVTLDINELISDLHVVWIQAANGRRLHVGKFIKIDGK